LIHNGVTRSEHMAGTDRQTPSLTPYKTVPAGG